MLLTYISLDQYTGYFLVKRLHGLKRKTIVLKMCSPVDHGFEGLKKKPIKTQ